jgi:hypothetical protein
MICHICDAKVRARGLSGPKAAACGIEVTLRLVLIHGMEAICDGLCPEHREIVLRDVKRPEPGEQPS